MLVRFHRVVPRQSCCGGVSSSVVHSRMTPLIDPPPSKATPASATAGPGRLGAVVLTARTKVVQWRGNHGPFGMK